MSLSVFAAQAGDRFIVVASTTSTENSGLFAHLLPIFTARTGIEVRVVAQGTGQALRTAANGDADVVFVHARAAEEKFIADGYGVQRHPVMFNDFIIVGPGDDPAGIGGGNDVTVALRTIAARHAAFASRGDDSGTHKAERRLWRAAGVTPAGDWYRETGAGMGATLNTAAQMGAYAMTDRATWIAFRNKGDMTIAVQDDKRLFNQYGVILVNPAKHGHVKAAEGQAFIGWLTSDEGQQAIAAYTVDGQQLFFPNASDVGA
ncbi:MAG: substrate-binding domain-containing protein [Alphaproteobacteria bacterium]